MSGEALKPGGSSERPYKDSRKLRGREAEELAAKYLLQEGYLIIDRNWRCRSGELDIVAEKDGMLVIVEVRSRSSQSLGFGTPAESMTPRKIRQVRDTAAVYMLQHGASMSQVRFDLIGIVLGPGMTSQSLDHYIASF